MKFIKSLQFIFKPSYWSMNYDYSSVWDYTLNQLLDKHTFTKTKIFTVTLGDFEIWIGNHPYASMRPVGSNFRASRLTIQRAGNRFRVDSINNLKIKVIK